MTRRAASAVVAAALVAASLVACRGDRPDPGPDHRVPGEQREPTPTTSEPEAPSRRARARVEGILLTPADLGPRWRAQGTTTTATGAEALALLHPCLQDGAGGDGLLVAARSPDLLHLTDDAERTVVTSAALLDDEAASRLFTRMAGDAFAACAVGELAADLARAAGAERTTETALGPVQPQPGTGVEAVGASAVISVSDRETSAHFDALVHLVALRADTAVALLIAQSLFVDLPEERLAAITRRLAQRLG